LHYDKLQQNGNFPAPQLWRFSTDQTDSESFDSPDYVALFLNGEFFYEILNRCFAMPGEMTGKE
jgi:hypothetical protein